MGWLTKIFSTAVSPVTNLLSSKDENKTKVTLSKIDRIKNADDALAEWEAIQAENSGNGWKDEYVTLIVTLPVPTIFFAVIFSVMFGDPVYAEAARAGIDAIKEILPNYQEILAAVCLAAIGIRALKK